MNTQNMLPDYKGGYVLLVNTVINTIKQFSLRIHLSTFTPINLPNLPPYLLHQPTSHFTTIAMQLTIALCATMLATAISAAPALAAREAVPFVTLSITNDRTGASAAVTVPSDGHARNIIDLFPGTAIDQHGAIVGTSAQLIKFSEKTHCFLQNYNWIINLYGKGQTYADLDGNKDYAIPTYLNGFNLQCSER
ncbi:hypothetical protein GQ44DRAFT_711005 [Phaeosphaeriaceae sp. PMI808]|nr:hypothetical protein GQ44DRAFT_711005 [Phaeosphaeriaceae sp. PMI808]